MPLNFTHQSFGTEGTTVNVFRQAQILRDFQPTFGQVTDAFVEEAFKGVGTLEADRRANEIERLEKIETPITEDEYKASEFFRDEISYYDGMTRGSSRVLASNADEVRRRSEVISRATGLQATGGFAASIGAGIFEPKNAGIGLATAIVGGQIANRVVGATRIAKAYSKYGKFKTLAAFGGVEGLVAATLAEPSNRESAKTLQQDYEMVDSLMNIGLSTAFGAFVNVAPAYIRDKINRNKTTNIVLDEVDTATSQIAEGRQVDITPVEAMHRKTPSLTRKQVDELNAKIFEKGAIPDDELNRILNFVELPEDIIQDVPIQQQKLLQEKVFLSEMQLRNFDDDAFIERSLQQQGAPTLIQKGLEERVSDYKAQRAQERATIDPGKRGKRLRLFDEETDRVAKGLEDEVKSFKDLNINEKIGIAKRQLQEKKQQIRGRVQGYQNELNIINDTLNTRIRESVVRTNDPSNTTAIEDYEIQAVEDYRAANPTDEIDVDRINQEIETARDAGLLDEEAEAALARFDAVNEEDIVAGLNAANVCLTRG